jgi:pyrimidine-nucleoside phosphorylase
LPVQSLDEPAPTTYRLQSLHVSASVYDLLNRKRRGQALAPDEIRQFVQRFTAGEIADYQMSAFLMAVSIRGMAPDELAALTGAMLESGEQWNLRQRFPGLADKHSTGGVGDKISLAVAPLVAACGVPVAMLSGRGLGHTGGTLDKLEAIPGFRANLSQAEVERTIRECGCVIATSTGSIAPADRRMYALRDVTGTVESIPLIVASIMSKKLALGPAALLLDVKCGSGAFTRTEENATRLAIALAETAAASNIAAESLITDMSRPLGIAIGNANEAAEAIDVLRGTAPEDVAALTKIEAVRMIVLSTGAAEPEAQKRVDEALASGAALESARRWLAAQGADPAVIDRPELLPQPREVSLVRARRSGTISKIDTYGLGMLAIELGAGRRQTDDEIDPAAGIMVDRNVGDRVRAGDTIARLMVGHSRRQADPQACLRLFELSEGPVTPRPLVLRSIRVNCGECGNQSTGPSSEPSNVEATRDRDRL